MDIVQYGATFADRSLVPMVLSFQIGCRDLQRRSATVTASRRAFSRPMTACCSKYFSPLR